MTPLVTESATRQMDDMAEWAVSNIVRLGPVSIETAADIASTRRALALAADMQRAQRIDDNVGRYVGGLNYLSVYLPVIREFVVVGYEYTPAEHTQDGDYCESVEIRAVWLRKVELGEMSLPYVDRLEAAIWAARKAVQS